MIARFVLHIGGHYRSVSLLQGCTALWNLCQCYFKFHLSVSVCRLGLPLYLVHFDNCENRNSFGSLLLSM